VSGWDTDFKNAGPKVTKVPHDELAKTDDKNGRFLASVAALLPEPKEADPKAVEKLDFVDAAARVGAAAAAARLARLQDPGQAEQDQFDQTLRDLAPGQRVTDPRTPKPKPTRPREEAPARNVELEEEIAKHEAEDAAVDEWLLSLENEGAEVNEEDIPALSDEAYNAWLAANREEAA
jgi:hypothetical protein